MLPNPHERILSLSSTPKDVVESTYIQMTPLWSKGEVRPFISEYDTSLKWWHMTQNTEAPKCLIKLCIPPFRTTSLTGLWCSEHTTEQEDNRQTVCWFWHPFQIILCCSREESLSVAAFQGRQCVETVQDEGHHLDTVDLNMSVVTRTWPSTCSSAKLALALLYSCLSSSGSHINVFLLIKKNE